MPIEKKATPPPASPQGGLLGLDLPSEAAKSAPVAPAKQKWAPQAAPLARHLPPPPQFAPKDPEAPVVEAVATPWIDPANYAWGAKLVVIAPGGELLAEDDAQGYITLRPDAENRMIVPTSRDLLGFAVDAAVGLLDGSRIPDGAKRFIDVDAETNGYIKVTLGDMVKAHSLTKFFYSRHAWANVIAATDPKTAGGSPARPVIRWAH